MLLADYNHMHKALDRLCRFYNTKILGLHLGDTPLIILNDEDKVKRALFHRDFDGRPDLLLARLRDPHFDLFGEYRILVQAHEHCFDERRVLVGDFWVSSEPPRAKKKSAGLLEPQEYSSRKVIFGTSNDDLRSAICATTVSGDASTCSNKKLSFRSSNTLT